MIDNHPLTDRDRTYVEVTDTSITYEAMTLRNDDSATPFPLEPTITDLFAVKSTRFLLHVILTIINHTHYDT